MAKEDVDRYEGKKKILLDRLVLLKEKRTKLVDSKKYSGADLASRLARVDVKIANTDRKVALCDTKIESNGK
jgi:predicted metallo-beta-lactamase superfamily hydrolase